MQKSKDRIVLKGDPRALGVTKKESGCNFAVSFHTKEDISLVLYKKGEEKPEEIIPIPEDYWMGSVASVYLPQFRPDQYEYNYQVGEKICTDPFATCIREKRAFGAIPENLNPHACRCGFENLEYDWEQDRRIERPYSETVLYKLHVRGYTMQRNSKVRHKGTFQGVVEKIPYFQELGITALELMPIYDFDEIILPENMPLKYAYKMKEKIKINYWGYTQGHYFAPKPSYSHRADGGKDVCDMVKALHKAGIECIMEFYFPQEIHELQVLQILRHWYICYHMDGFHLIGDGVPTKLIRQDPLLQNAKLMFTSLSEETSGEGADPRNRNLAEYNERFKQEIRQFLKSDEDSLKNAVVCMRRNPLDHAVINYLSCQDGFTLMDTVSYDAKHNQANGEDNCDGNSYNYSWNCGVEGPSRKRTVRKLREKQIRNAFLLLLFSQGVPMLYAGDEFGNSQEGNNNAYCQDNEIGWVDWSCFKRNQGILQFVKEAIAFRKRHPILHPDRQLKLMDYKSIGYPDLSYHSGRAWYAAYDNVSYYIGMMFCGAYEKTSSGEEDSYLYIAYNFHWESHEFALPNLPDKQKWCHVIQTTEEVDKAFFFETAKQLDNQKMIVVPPRSIEVYMGQQEKMKTCILGNISKQSQDIK